MIHVLVGHSASGKSTIERRLERRYGIPRIISYTTRPPREGEEDDVDYHFVTEDEFQLMEKHGYFTEVAKYREWNYGLTTMDIDYRENDYIAVVTPKGYRELLDVVKQEWIRSYFISVNERERLIRLANRGDNIDEVIRRIKADRIDFADFESEANYIIENRDIDKSVDMIYTIIKCLNK